MAQLVKRLTLNFRSGLDLTVREFKPPIGLCADNVGPARDSVSLSAPPLLALDFSLKQINSLFDNSKICVIPESSYEICFVFSDCV